MKKMKGKKIIWKKEQDKEEEVFPSKYLLRQHHTVARSVDFSELC